MDTKIAFTAFLAAVLLLTGCQTVQPPAHFTGQTYSGAFEVNTGGTSVPLPDGEWVLAGYEREVTSQYGAITRAMLFQLEGNKWARGIFVYAQRARGDYWSIERCLDEVDSGWEPWVLHQEVVTNFSSAGGASAHDCWEIFSWWMNRNRSASDSTVWNQAMIYADRENIRMPRKAVVVRFIQSRTNPARLHMIGYGFNAEIDGDLTPAQNLPSNWRVENYDRNEKRRGYIEGKKQWAAKWREAVGAGMAGELPLDEAP